MLPGNRCGRDDDIAFGNDVRHELPLPAIEVFVHRFGVTAFVFGLSGVQFQFDKLPAEALHLLAAGGANIVIMNDRAQPLGGGDD